MSERERRVAVADAELRGEGDVECPACYGMGDTMGNGTPWIDHEAFVRPEEAQLGVTVEDQRRADARTFARHTSFNPCPCCRGWRVVDRASAADWLMRRKETTP